jgi:thiol-disulfide isomerase/thioredoxin
VAAASSAPDSSVAAPGPATFLEAEQARASNASPLRPVNSTTGVAAPAKIQSAAGAISTSAIVLTKGAIDAMSPNRSKIAASVLIAIGSLSAATAWAWSLRAESVGEPALVPTHHAIESAGSPPAGLTERAGPPGDESRSRVYTVEARDLETDAPVPGVKLVLNVMSGGGDGPRLAATTDASGTARVTPSSAGDVRSISVSANRDGYVPLAIHWDRKDSSSKVPDRFLFRMERGAPVRGLVLDQHGKPVGGATVVIRASKGYPGSPQRIDLDFASTTADASGRWSFPNVPKRGVEIGLTAYHHSCLGDRNFYHPEPFKPESALRDGSAVLRLDRGTLVEGTVVGPDGKPVPGAEVLYGEGSRRAANLIPALKADARGGFSLGIKPGVATSLTIQHPGYGPVRQSLRVGAEPRRLTVTLPPGRTIRGRLVDRAGKPLRGRLEVTSWRGSETLQKELLTDADGRFIWDDAPGDEIVFRADSIGYSAKDDVTLGPGEHTIVLDRRITLKGTVVDAATGLPIPKFSVSMATVKAPGKPLIWQRGLDLDGKSEEATGAFEYPLNIPAHQYLLRVHADGYLPADSPRFSAEGGPRPLTFRLAKAGPIRGTVLNADGSPARGGTIYLVRAGDYFKLWDGDASPRDHKESIRATIAPDGDFSLPPQAGAYVLVAPVEAGIAIVSSDELRADHAIRLTPWARASGTIKIDGRPAVDSEHFVAIDEATRPENGPHIDIRGSFRTDSSGRFEFARLMPGRHVLGYPVPNGQERRDWFINLATLDVKGGEKLELKIGERGRKVTGVLKFSTASSDWMIRKAEIAPRGAGAEAILNNVRIGPDRRFRAQDLEPGDYTLRIALHEPPPENACGWGRLIAGFSREFSVTGGPDDPPLDLGALEPSRAGGEALRVGDHAPDFAVKTLDGKDLKLVDFKGRVVLLDFWATWCAPCVAELPNLKAIHEAHARDPRFAVVSLSLDEQSADAADVVKGEKLAWLQGFVGPESAVVTAYGASAVPATFLIGPDGTILAANLRGEALKSAVAKALKP